MWKILHKNILALYRYRDFRVGIFYFASPCIWHWRAENSTDRKRDKRRDGQYKNI